MKFFNSDQVTEVICAAINTNNERPSKVIAATIEALIAAGEALTSSRIDLEADASDTKQQDCQARPQ